MKWSKIHSPQKDVNYYDHVICETPLGNITIEWKSWKDKPSYDIVLPPAWVGCAYSLEDAKALAEKHLRNKMNELKKFLK